MIKKYNIILNEHGLTNQTVDYARFWNIKFKKKSLNQRELSRLHSQNRSNYNLEKFYLTNKDLWYIQKKQYLQLHLTYKQTKNIIVKKKNLYNKKL